MDPTLPPDIPPTRSIVRVAIGADHSGVALKAALITHLRQAGKSVTDVGMAGPEPVDYPDIAAAVAVAVARGEADAGIVIDGAGLGLGDCGQQGPGRPGRDVHDADAGAIRAAAQRRQRARARRDDPRSGVQAREIVDTWLSTPMSEARYIRRLLKVRRLEERF